MYEAVPNRAWSVARSNAVSQLSARSWRISEIKLRSSELVRACHLSSCVDCVACVEGRDDMDPMMESAAGRAPRYFDIDGGGAAMMFPVSRVSLRDQSGYIGCVR